MTTSWPPSRCSVKPSSPCYMPLATTDRLHQPSKERLMNESAATTTADQIGAHFEEHTVTVDGLRVRYYQAGQGDPLIVLHGAGGLRFSRALDLLTLDRRVVCIEMPGWGDHPDYRCETLEQLAET